MNIWKANGFNNSPNTIEINYELNHVNRNTNNFVAAYCEIDTISRLHHLLEGIDKSNCLNYYNQKNFSLFQS